MVYTLIFLVFALLPLAYSVIVRTGSTVRTMFSERPAAPFANHWFRHAVPPCYSCQCATRHPSGIFRTVPASVRSVRSLSVSGHRSVRVANPVPCGSLSCGISGHLTPVSSTPVLGFPCNTRASPLSSPLYISLASQISLQIGSRLSPICHAPVGRFDSALSMHSSLLLRALAHARKLAFPFRFR